VATFFVQQALHGYADGHQLLASSLALDSEQESQLLLQSDLSGPGFRSGFDGYLTGYPLIGHLYVLARTWFAPEMARPSCVWTHSLLVPDEALAQLRDLRELLPLFRRPRGRADTDSYSRSLNIHMGGSPPSPIVPDRTGQVIELLYSTRATVIIPAEASEPFEGMALAIFNQQWPRLRRSFRFCTGVLAPRTKGFDLMAIPGEDASSLPTQASGPYRIVSTERQPKAYVSPWVTIASEDLGRGADSSLRHFLWSFGPDYSDGRSVFRVLCELFAYLDSDNIAEGMSNSLSLLAQFFPNPEASARLKVSLFAPGGEYSRKSRGDFLVLRTLVTHPGSASLPSTAICLDLRAQELLRVDPEGALTLAAELLDLRSLPTASEYLDVIAVRLPNLTGLPSRIPFPLLEVLIERNHRVATLGEVWRRGIDEQLVIFGAIAPFARNDPDFATAVVRAMLSVESWRLVRQAIRSFGADAIGALADWLPSQISDSQLSIPSEVLTCIAEQADELVAGSLAVRSGGLLAKVLSGVLDPRTPRVRTLGIDIWLTAARTVLTLSDQRAELHSRAFLVAVGMTVPDFRGAELLAAGFASVHAAAAESQLPEALWQMIESSLPWYAFTWDRCIRMVRGALRGFLESGWERQYFFKVFSTDLARQQALSEAGWSWEGRGYLRRLWEEHLRGTVVLDDKAASDLSRRVL
jgi:hypothetical protein